MLCADRRRGRLLAAASLMQLASFTTMNFQTFSEMSFKLPHVGRRGGGRWSSRHHGLRRRAAAGDARGAHAHRPRDARRLIATDPGCAQNESSVQSQVSRGTGTTSTRVRAAEPAGERGRRGKDAAVELVQLGQIVGHQPHRARDLGVAGDEHDRPGGDATQLADARLLRAPPVVDRQDRHRGVDGAVAQRQRLGGRAQRRRQRARPLRCHDVARLDGDDVAVARLVGAGAGAHVDDGARVAERGHDAREQARSSRRWRGGRWRSCSGSWPRSGRGRGARRPGGVVRGFVAAHAPAEQLGVERHVRLHRRQRLRAQPRPVDRPRRSARAVRSRSSFCSVHGERLRQRAPQPLAGGVVFRPPVGGELEPATAAPPAAATDRRRAATKARSSVAPASATCPWRSCRRAA